MSLRNYKAFKLIESQNGGWIGPSRQTVNVHVLLNGEVIHGVMRVHRKKGIVEVAARDADGRFLMSPVGGVMTRRLRGKVQLRDKS